MKQISIKKNYLKLIISSLDFQSNILSGNIKIVDEYLCENFEIKSHKQNRIQNHCNSIERLLFPNTCLETNKELQKIVELNELKNMLKDILNKE